MPKPQQSSMLKKSGSSFFVTPLPEYWRRSTNEMGQTFYYHELTRATIFYEPPPLIDGWKVTRDAASGIVYFYNTLTRTTLPLGTNPPRNDAGAIALRTGLAAPPAGKPPAVTEAGISKKAAVSREPKAFVLGCDEVARLKLQLGKSISTGPPSYTIEAAAAEHAILIVGALILTIDGTAPADVEQATALLQKAEHSSDDAKGVMTIELADSRPAEPLQMGMLQRSMSSFSRKKSARKP